MESEENGEIATDLGRCGVQGAAFQALLAPESAAGACPSGSGWPSTARMPR